MRLALMFLLGCAQAPLPVRPFTVDMESHAWGTPSTLTLDGLDGDTVTVATSAVRLETCAPELPDLCVKMRAPQTVNAPIVDGQAVVSLVLPEGPQLWMQVFRHTDVTTEGGGLLRMDLQDPATTDRDEDGLSDADELRLGTFIDRPDSDGSGVFDGNEVARGLDPLDPSDDREDCTLDADMDQDGRVGCLDADCRHHPACLKDARASL